MDIEMLVHASNSIIYYCKCQQLFLDVVMVIGFFPAEVKQKENAHDLK